MGLNDLLDLADKALDIAKHVPGLSGAAKIADVVLDAAKEGLPLLTAADQATAQTRLAAIQQRVTAHHAATTAALREAAKR